MSGPLINQERVILGPLNATWTAPSSCSIAVEDCQTCSLAWAAQTCFSSSSGSSVRYAVEDNTDCWPPRSSFASAPSPPLAGWGFYSPGLDCPYGMASACSATGGGFSGWAVQFGLLSQETEVGCCPPGYSCSNNLAQTCVQIATSTSFQAVTCESGTSGHFTYLTIPATISTVAIPSYTLYAPMIQINWQATDRPTSSSTTSSSGTSSSTPPPSSGLSSGAKAGIGVGVTLAALALLALGFFIYWKRRHAYAQARQDSPAATQMHELGATKKGPYATSELPTRENISELPPGEDGGAAVHELHG